MTVSPSTWKARRLVRGRAAALCVAAAVTVGIAARLYVLDRSPIFVSDTFQNLLLARSLWAGAGFQSGGAEHPDASRAVLFPSVVALVAPIAGDVEAAARWVVVLAGALSVVPLFMLARSMFGPRAALGALPLGAVSCLVAASDRLLATSLYVLLALTAAALAWRARSAGSLSGWVAPGFFAGLAALARPEGLAFPFAFALWSVLDGGRPRRGFGRRAAGAGVVLAAALAVYAPYAAWSSARLGRFAPAPGIAYVQMERIVSDHLGLREIPSPVAWTERARFMLTADHRALYLETAFLTGRFPAPDPESVPAGRELQTGAPITGPVSAAPGWWNLVLRRWYILRSNILLLPRKAAWDHFLPPMVAALALIGLVFAPRTRRGRAAVGFLLLTTLAALSPVVSHLESRFYLVPFGLGTVLAAGGWAALGNALARSHRGRLDAVLRVAAQAVVIAGIAISGLRHEPPQLPARARIDLLRREGAALSALLPTGPVLAIQPHLPYWAGHPYRPIPAASPSAILDYARSQGARGLALEGARDLEQRPDLEWLVRDDRPPEFRIVRRTPHSSGGELLVFEIAASRTS
ncbi:MAG TPA: glycosyltransferase family 39 protein [Candidatus Polarisedimenticolaceae bacterium]|nr:glycosyltransferase family 39 protein [Candidatus Polarisedimenticolaceae bacterium]